MHDPRTSTALRHLADLTGDPPAPRWTGAVMRIDPKGRIGLPRDALDALGTGPFTLRWHRLAVVLEPDVAGRAAPDGRGRVRVPSRLRRPSGTYLIGTDRDRRLIVIAPTAVLDGFGVVLAGTER